MVIVLLFLSVLFSYDVAEGIIPILPIFENPLENSINEDYIYYLPSAVNLGKSSVNTTVIHDNGILSFASGDVNVSNTSPLPLSGAKILAPFWTDSKPTQTKRQVTYSLITNTSDEHEYYINEVNQFLLKSQMLMYDAKWILAVQWTYECPYDNCEQEMEQENVFQLVLTTDGTTSLAIFTYQCSQEIAIHSSTVIGYSVNNELYRQHPVSNFTELACKNLPYSNFTNLVYQLNYGIPLLAVMPIDTIGQEGSSVKFYCTAQAVPHVETVIWRINGVQLPPMGSSHRTISTTQEGDITQSVLTLSSLSRYLDNGNTYTCTVSNSEGSVESISGTLTVNQPAVISAIVPMLINQKENVPAQLSCGAVGQPLPLIKWYSPNGDELMDSDSIRIQTHTSFMSITSFLLFNPLKYEYTGNYNCTAINLAHGLGNPVSMDTQSVTVTVQTGPVLEYSGSTSDAVIVLLGETLTIEFMIIRAEPAITINNIEWTFSKDSSKENVCEYEMSECELFGHKASLVITNSSMNNDGIYEITVTNIIDRASKALTVYLTDHARITTPSVFYVLNETDQLILHCTATGIPAPVISWTKEQQSFVIPSINTDPVKDSNGVYTVESILELSSVVYADRGMYVCSAMNALIDGSPFSSAAVRFNVSVQTLPTIIPYSSFVNEITGQLAEMGVAITRGTPPVQLSWTFIGVPINTMNRYTLSDDGKSLVISNVSLTDRGIYVITASNPAGKTSTEITLDILAPSTVYTPTPHVIVNKSFIAVLTCIGMGHPLPDIYWKRQDGQILPEEREIMMTSTTENVTLEDQYVQSTLVLSNVTSTDDGGYICTAINSVTLTEATVLLTVQVQPTIEVVGLSNIDVLFHRDSTELDAVVDFKITAGIPREFYWSFVSSMDDDRSVALPANNSSKYIFHHTNQKASLTILNVGYFDQGRYMLKVTNAVGSAEESIELSINVETQIIGDDVRNIRPDEHASVTLTCTADGVPRPSAIFWFRNGTLIDPLLFRKINVTQSDIPGFRAGNSYPGITSMLTIADVNPRIDNGVYTCRSTNGIGQPAVLNYPYILKITQAPLLNICALNQPCNNGGTCVDTQSSYYCICTFDYTGQNCQKAVIATVAPKIVNPPQNTTVDLYGQLTLTCTVTGSPVPRVTWYKDGEVVSDGDVNTNELTIVETSLKDRGFYHCEATGKLSSGEIVTVVSPIGVVNLRGVVQYKAWLVIHNGTDQLNTSDSMQNLVDKINEFVAGSIIKGDSSLFFIQLLDPNDHSINGGIPIVITIINSQGGSDELLFAVQKGLNRLSIGLEIDVTIEVTDRHDGCQSDTTVIESWPVDPRLDVVIKWPEVNIGEEAVVKCPCGDGVDLGAGSLEARRYCGGTFTGGARWDEGFIANCNFSNRAREICNLASLPSLEKISKLSDITETELSSTEVSVASSILLTTRYDALGKTNVTEDFLEVVDNINGMPMETIRGSVKQANVSARLLETVELLAENLRIPETEDSLSIKKKTILIDLQTIDANTDNGTTYGFRNNSEENGMNLNSVFLPQRLVEQVKANTTDNSTSPVIILTTYLSSSMFTEQRQNTNLQIDSVIVSASISGYKVENLKDPVVIIIRTKPAPKQSCRFWNSSLNYGYGEWSQKGCTSYTDEMGNIICMCNHLTNFAVLLDASPDPVKPINSAVGHALNAISYIGVILSIFCLLVTITTYLVSRKLRCSEHGRMLLNLCFSLLGLYVSFILALHGTSVPELCAAISVLLQYFLLVTFFVMAAEALNLYMKLVIVLGKGITRYFFKATFVSWTVPVFIVLFCFAPNYEYYIGDHFCRVYDVPFYFGVLVPFVIIYVFNWTLFVIIMLRLLGRRCKTKYNESSTKNQNMSFKQQFMIAITLSLLFGLGWGVGLLATQSLYTVTAIRDTFAVLFILLTSFQGLFIFIMHCVRSKEVRKEWIKWGYRMVGKEPPLSVTNSSVSHFSTRRTTMRKQDTISTARPYLYRSETLEKNTGKSFDEGDDIITGHELERFEKMDENHDIAQKSANLNQFPNSPDIETFSSTFPLPTGIRLSQAFAPDFQNPFLSPSPSTGSGLCRNYDNPVLVEDILTSKEEDGLTSSESKSDVCSNFPNPMNDND